MNPKVSVIVPGYNHGPFLKERLESILNQTYRNFELILLDDASNDSSQTILSKYVNNPFVSHVVFNETNSGSTFLQWQKGLKLANSDLIWIAESDDVAAPTLLENLVSVFEKDENVDVVFCRTDQINDLGVKIGINDWAEKADERDWGIPFCNFGVDEINKLFRFRCMIPNASSAVFKKAASKQIEEIAAEGYRYCGDWLFWLHIFKSGKVCYIPQILNSQRIHAQTTRLTKSFIDETKRINELVCCISFAHQVCKKKIKWSDARLAWVFDYYRIRISFGKKFLPRYWFSVGSKQFLLQLFIQTIFKR